jgi:hypothetical protein
VFLFEGDRELQRWIVGRTIRTVLRGDRPPDFPFYRLVWWGKGVRYSHVIRVSVIAKFVACSVPPGASWSIAGPRFSRALALKNRLATHTK